MAIGKPTVIPRGPNLGIVWEMETTESPAGKPSPFDINIEISQYSDKDSRAVVNIAATQGKETIYIHGDKVNLQSTRSKSTAVGICGRRFPDFPWDEAFE